MTDLQTLATEYERLTEQWTEIDRKRRDAIEAFLDAWEAKAKEHGFEPGDDILVTEAIHAIMLERWAGLRDYVANVGAKARIDTAQLGGGNGTTGGVRIHIHDRVRREFSGIPFEVVADARRAWLAQQEQAAG